MTPKRRSPHSPTSRLTVRAREIPELTARVTRASNPHGTTAMAIRDHLDGLWSDEDFVEWCPRDGKPGLSPARLATVCVLRFLMELSDRQAAEGVRCRIDSTYALARGAGRARLPPQCSDRLPRAPGRRRPSRHAPGPRRCAPPWRNSPASPAGTRRRGHGGLGPALRTRRTARQESHPTQNSYQRHRRRRLPSPPLHPRGRPRGTRPHRGRDPLRPPPLPPPEAARQIAVEIANATFAAHVHRQCDRGEQQRHHDRAGHVGVHHLDRTTARGGCGVVS